MVTAPKDNRPAAEKVHTGGEFIFQPVLSSPVFTPEHFTDDQRQYQKTAEDFMRDEVEPRAEEIDHKKPGLMTQLMKRAADLGLFMVEIPEAYGGLGLDKVTSMLIAEQLVRVGSF